MPQLMIHTYENHTDEQRRALVKAATETVSKASGAGPKSIGFFFMHLERRDRALAGRLMSDVEDPGKLPADETPWLLVQIQMFEGRSLDQKRAISKGLTEDIVNCFGIVPDRVQIIFSDMNRIDNAIGGVLGVDR